MDLSPSSLEPMFPTSPEDCQGVAKTQALEILISVASLEHLSFWFGGWQFAGWEGKAFEMAKMSLPEEKTQRKNASALADRWDQSFKSSGGCGFVNSFAP